MLEDTEYLDVDYASNQKTNRILNLGRSIEFFAISLFIIIFLTLLAFWQINNLNKPSENFPTLQAITIEPGTDVKTIAESFERQSVVKSGLLLYYTLVMLNEPTQIKASSYVFESPMTTFQIAKRLTEGDFDTNLIRITHYEGERVTALAARMSKHLANFDAANFILIAEPHEGKLFPDTYFVPENYTAEEFLDLLLDTFNKKTNPLNDKISSHPLSLDEIIILASIIEREADDKPSKKMVSGILQNRLAIDMPLQADASIEYILDKPLNELTPEDLKIDSPYNTYLNLGLPPTPIGNPGLEAIEAVLEPTPSDYYYYITDGEGEFHYSTTYNEHLKNIKQYLR